MENLSVEIKSPVSMLDDRIDKLYQQTEMLKIIARNLERISDKFLGKNIEPLAGLDVDSIEKTKESCSLYRIDSIIDKIDITGGLIEKYTRRLEEGI